MESTISEDDVLATHDIKTSYSRAIFLIVFCLYLFGVFVNEGDWPDSRYYLMAVLLALAAAGFFYLSALTYESLSGGKE